MKIKRQDLISLWISLGVFAQQKMNPKASYAFLKNKNIIADEIKTIEEIQQAQNEKLPKGYLDYEDKRINVCKELAVKDEEGNPKMETKSAGRTQYVILDEDQEEFQNKINELLEEHKEDIEIRKEMEKEIIDFLNDEIDIELYQVPLELLPVDLTPQEMEVLLPIIKE